MSTLRFLVTQQDVNDEGTLVTEKEFAVTATYSQTQKMEFSQSSSNVYTTLEFGRVNSVTAFILTTTQTISLKVNGSSDEIVVYGQYTVFGDVSSLEIKNNSGTSATITVNIYGS
jgi:hypothetical protein